MGQARELMDRMTECMRKHDFEGLASVYASNAVITTPDEGDIEGRDGILGYLQRFSAAVPTSTGRSTRLTNPPTRPWTRAGSWAPTPGPSKRRARRSPPPVVGCGVRACDVATVRDDQIVNHNFYFDQMELLGQLGLVADQPA